MENWLRSRKVIENKVVSHIKLVLYWKQRSYNLVGDGSIRIGSSRVTLDSVGHEFTGGATAEQIQLPQLRPNVANPKAADLRNRSALPRISQLCYHIHGE